MAKPPPTPPSSDIHGVNRDARAGATPDLGGGTADTLRQADDANKARPDETEPPEKGVGEGRD